MPKIINIGSVVWQITQSVSRKVSLSVSEQVIQQVMDSLLYIVGKVIQWFTNRHTDKHV